VYLIPKAYTGSGRVVKDLLKANDERGMFDQVVQALDMEMILDRDIDQLSGGELQRFAIASTLVQEADVYIFDEPSSFLDIQQRIKSAKLIRAITENQDK
jgi:ATP-binding cassette subfamily E protein 1